MGEYHDRLFNTEVDCKQTTWIVATNLSDDIIRKYYTKHLEKLDEQKRNDANLKLLQASLKHEYCNNFGASTLT